MSSVKDFILKDISVLEETKEISFPQFNTPFKIRSIGAEEMQQITNEATRKVRNKKTHQTTEELDNQKLLDILIEKAVVVPDLTSAELQEAYGTLGNAAATARKMLKAGQYIELTQQVQAISGYDVDEIVEEIKN